MCIPRRQPQSSHREFNHPNLSLAGGTVREHQKTALQYVDLEIVRYISSILASAEKRGITLACSYEAAEAKLCGKPVEYLVPDATRSGGGGYDIEQRPAMFCREHLEEMLGHAPEEQPIFKRFEGPDE